MNVAKLEIQDAFSEGAELWVIKNDPKLKMWQELNFRSHFLLTQNLLDKKSEPPPKLLEILSATSLETVHTENSKDFTLIGCGVHFHCKWIMVWNEGKLDHVSQHISKLANSLKLTGVRIFSDNEKIVSQLKSSPLASSINISFIEV